MGEAERGTGSAAMRLYKNVGSTSLVARTKMLAIKMQKSGQSQDILWK